MHYKIPTLDASGWATTPQAVINRVLLNYVSSNPLQSVIFYGKVVSLQSAIFHANGDMVRITSEVNSGLTKVLTNYFPEGVSVESETRTLEDDSSKFSIDINIKVTVDGVSLDGAVLLSNLTTNYLNLVDVGYTSSF